MSAAVLDRPRVSPKKAAKTVEPASVAGFQVPPGMEFKAETALDFYDLALEKLGVASAITSVCLNAVGGDHPRTHKMIPWLVRHSMKHVQRLLMDIEGTPWASDISPHFDGHYEEVCVLVELFNEFCICYGHSGGSEFKFCDDIISNMLWAIDTAFNALQKLVSSSALSQGPEGEAA